MAVDWSKVASTALELGSGIVSFLSSGHGMRRQYKYQRALQDQQNKFYERLSNTAHQREVADLRAAGLNPILSATGGQGAASAMGAAGQSTFANDAEAGLNSALAIRNTNSQVKLNDSQKDLNESNSFTSRKQASLLGEQARNEAEKFDSIIQDRINSIALTGAQVDYYKKLGDSAIKNAISQENLSTAQAWRAYHQALGFSESESESSSQEGAGSLDVHALSFGTGNSYKKSKSSSRSRSRTY